MGLAALLEDDVDLQEKLAGFSTDQLRAELSRRGAQAAQDARDKTPRQYYRLLEFCENQKSAAKAFAKLPEAEQKTAILDNCYLYGLDTETPEMLATRLSRTAELRWDYDHWFLTLRENGSKVGGQGQDSDSDFYASDWESRGGDDFDLEWNLERAEDFLGHSSKPASRYQY